MNRYLQMFLATAIPLGIVTGTALTASAGKVRIELLDVKCGNTEDVTGADEFYIVGAMSDGTNTKAALTSPTSINDGQTKSFLWKQQVIFDANVPQGVTVRGGLKAYDEDFGKDWSKYSPMVNKITDDVRKELEDADEKKAANILKWAVKAFGFFASLDKDDELGKLELNVSASGPAVEERTWNFRKTSSFWNPGWSTWDYTVRYRITRS